MTAAQTAAVTVTEPASSVSLKGISRRFGEAYAVKRVDLELPQGEFFALLGPSGCGKTTTLRMVGGFELPTAGRIHLAGKDVTMLPPHKRDVNTVFQSYALFPHLSVIENVAFGLRRDGISKSEAMRRADEHLELVGLAGFDKRRPSQLSGGQQQRVALARALVNHPKVLLLDEPMGALDAKIRKSMQLELKRIQREVGITFLYVTHDQAEAMSMADRLAVMNAGLIEDMGVPQRVYDRPATQFVAEFLGTCNILPVTTDNGIRLPDGGVVDATGYDAPVGEAGWKVGIRPEKLELSPIGAAARLGVTSGPNRTTATVSEVTYLGASTEARLETPWGSVLQAYKQNIGDGSTAIHPGDLVEVSWHASQCFLLPPSPAAATAADEEVAA